MLLSLALGINDMVGKGAHCRMPAWEYFHGRKRAALLSALANIGFVHPTNLGESICVIWASRVLQSRIYFCCSCHNVRMYTYRMPIFHMGDYDMAIFD